MQEGGADLAGLMVTAVSTSQYTVDLSQVTGAAGSYILTLRAVGANIQDLAGNLLADLCYSVADPRIRVR